MTFIGSLLKSTSTKPEKKSKRDSKDVTDEENMSGTSANTKKEKEKEKKKEEEQVPDKNTTQKESDTEEDSASESEDSSDSENESSSEKDNENASDSNEEDQEEETEPVDTEKMEANKLKNEDSDDVSRKNSAQTENEHSKKKNKLQFNKKKVQLYFHKSYDKVSNAIKRTSKSLFKPHPHGDGKESKKGSVHSIDILNQLDNIEKEFPEDESDFSDDNHENIRKYFTEKMNQQESNEEIIKKISTLLENNNDSKKVLEELEIILNDRTIFLKYINYLRIMNTNYRKKLHKSNNSYDILKSENEQLAENVKMLKMYISNLDKDSQNKEVNGNDKNEIESDCKNNNTTDKEKHEVTDAHNNNEETSGDNTKIVVVKNDETKIDENTNRSSLKDQSTEKERVAKKEPFKKVTRQINVEESITDSQILIRKEVVEESVA